VKRRVDLADITGVTKTVSPTKSPLEFTIHIALECDLRYVSCNKETIVDLIKRLYYIAWDGKNLPLFHAPVKDLEAYTTTEKDFKKGKSRYPPPEMRFYGEDFEKPTEPIVQELESPTIMQGEGYS
jgi:hypothetical protein